MIDPKFIHLRVHSSYSLSKSAIKVSSLPDLCKKNQMPSVAITDINNLFGVMDIAKTLSGNGIQHIVGSQITLKIIEKSGITTSGDILLIAKDEIGYKNLIKLSTLSYEHPNLSAEGPFLLTEHLEQYNEGLICLTGGEAGPFGQFMINKSIDNAENLLIKFKDLFQDRLYIEIMRHGLPNQNATEQSFLDLALKHNLPIVATNDVYFAKKDMFEAHDVLLCISNSRYLGEENREKSNFHKYFKSQDEMLEIFKDLPEALENTVNIAKRCSFILEERDPILPPFESETGLCEKDELRRQAIDGLEKRLQSHVYPELSKQFKNQNEEYFIEKEKITQKYKERLESELNVIETMGFPGYFLIVSDFIKYAKNQNIPVGPGRGSGAGSLVAWSLTITDIDPIRFSLIFERFLNPERVSMPDFDVDFCQARRNEVIDYVVRKYGADKVAQIITFGKLQARAVLRDVGRVLEIPYMQVDRVCRLIPNNPTNPVTLQEAIDGDKTFDEMMKEDNVIERLIDIGLKLEGLYRHASTHAAGVVIGGEVISDIVPLYYDGDSNMAITQINMKFIEKAGLLKFDFLGLKTLSIIQTCVDLLNKRGIKISISEIPLDDKKTFELLCNVNVLGVFQLESGGMRDVLKKLRPDRLEDIIALVALYRPGPMDDIPKYLSRKHGEEVVTYPHNSIAHILEPTYGVMVYQEQVMQIAQVMGGYTMGGADILRRAMGKKNKEEMAAQRIIFVNGAIKNGVDEETASHIFDLMSKFASYGFNKSHSAPYALISYQTAYLKANYPLEFFAATASFDKNNTEKLIELFQDLKENNIELLPPNINKSFVDFMPENGAMRYALSAIKNVGEGAMAVLIDERIKNGEFKSIEDFASRIDPSSINKRQLENLIGSGALDCLNSNRKELFESVDLILRYANCCKQDRSSNIRSLFGEVVDNAQESLKLKVFENDWNLLERTQKEFSALGFFLGDHLLDLYKDITNSMDLHNSSMFNQIASEKGSIAKFAAIILSKEERSSRNGSKFAFLTFSDKFGMFEIPFFSESYVKIRNFIAPGMAVYVEAMVRSNEDGSYRMTGVSLEKLEDKVLTQELILKINEDFDVENFDKILKHIPFGNFNIILKIQLKGLNLKINIPNKYLLDSNAKANLLSVQGVFL